MTHISNYLSYVPKSVSAFFGAVIAFVMTFSAIAAPAVRIESDLGVANVTAGDSTYDDSVSAGYDEVVKVQLWYHNMEEVDSGLVAEDLTVKFDVPTEQGKVQKITGTVGASNSNTVTNEVTVNLHRDDAYLEYIPGSAKWRHNAGTNDNVNYQTVDISDDVVTNGAGLNIEDADPCFNFEATVTILLRVRVPSIQLEKSVAIPGSGQTWDDSIEVNPGDRVKFLLTVLNDGNAPLSNVFVGDGLPEGLNYVKGSTVLTNSNHPDGTPVSSDNLVDGGININAFAIGGHSFLTFEATVVDAHELDCGMNTLVNKAVARSDKASPRTAEATVKVNRVCEEEPEEFSYDCKALNVSILDEAKRQVRAEAVITKSDNVSVIGTEIDFGGGNVSTDNPAEFTFATAGTKTINATVAFQLGDDTKEVKEATCSNTVKFGDVQGEVDEPELPNTGAGSAIVALFGATSAAAAAYGYIQDRRNV